MKDVGKGLWMTCIGRVCEHLSRQGKMTGGKRRDNAVWSQFMDQRCGWGGTSKSEGERRVDEINEAGRTGKALVKAGNGRKRGMGMNDRWNRRVGKLKNYMRN